MAPHSSTQHFGDLLRRYRLGGDLSQEALAERAGLSARGISDLERGVNRRPQRETVLRLADALALSAEERAAFVRAAQRAPPRRGETPLPGARSRPAPLELPPSSLLPVPLTALVGREDEVRMLTALLRRDPAVPPERAAGARLVTLTGPGGVGKTRLALAAAAVLTGAFADGVVFVPLASLHDPGLLLAALAQSIGLRPRGVQALLAELVDQLRARQLLLVLDNCEHLLAAAPDLASVLEACPGVSLLATSRAALRLRGERELPVEPLAVPDLRQLPASETLARIPAVALFLERVREHHPAFTLDAANTGTVAAVCVRLEGLPLALELAAAQSRYFSPRALLARLERRLAALTGGPRDLPARQQTMRATIAWSYDLLTGEEQALFRRVAVFAGGCTLEAIASLCRAGDVSAGAVPEGAWSLVDKSLLRRAETAAGEPRFGMLETIREYGLERLESEGEAAMVRRAHAHWCLALAEEAAPHLIGPEQAAWLARLEAEHDNLREALRWTQGCGEIVIGLRLAGALHRFWLVRGYLSEGRSWLEALLGAASALEADAAVLTPRAAALNGAGLLAGAQGDHAQAIARYEESLTLYRQLGDRRGIARALNNLGLVVSRQGDDERAAALFEESLALYRELGDTHGMGGPLNNLGGVALAASDYTRATALFEESLTIARQMSEPRGIAIALSNLSYAAWHLGAYARAAALGEESLALRRELGDREGVAIALSNLGEVACLRGDMAQAAALQVESLTLFRELGMPWGVVYCLQRLALLMQALGPAPTSQVHAARLFGATAALRASIGFPLPSNERARVDPALAACRAALGEGAFEAAWAEGCAMRRDQAIAYALGTCPASAPARRLDETDRDAPTPAPDEES